MESVFKWGKLASSFNSSNKLKLVGACVKTGEEKMQTMSLIQEFRALRDCLWNFCYNANVIGH